MLKPSVAGRPHVKMVEERDVFFSSLFFGIQKTKQTAFLDTKVFFWDTKCFSGYKKWFLTFGGQWGLINCKFVLDILEGQKRQGWDSTVGDPKSSRKSSSSTNNRKSGTKNQ